MLELDISERVRCRAGVCAFFDGRTFLVSTDIPLSAARRGSVAKVGRATSVGTAPISGSKSPRQHPNGPASISGLPSIILGISCYAVQSTSIFSPRRR